MVTWLFYKQTSVFIHFYYYLMASSRFSGQMRIFKEEQQCSWERLFLGLDSQKPLKIQKTSLDPFNSPKVPRRNSFFVWGYYFLLTVQESIFFMENLKKQYFMGYVFFQIWFPYRAHSGPPYLPPYLNYLTGRWAHHKITKEMTRSSIKKWEGLVDLVDSVKKAVPNLEPPVFCPSFKACEWPKVEK